ncbi:MAG: alpha-2-macroglobulin family protein [Candidatus Tectimicrobiota bacterium]
MQHIAFLLMFLVIFGLGATARAQAPVRLDSVQRVDGVQVLPETFLRSWDPITIFFEHDQGPAHGGPEDAPERLVSMQPPVPGAWQWLGARALQFRPADPWQPLQRIVVSTAGRSTRLVPLLPIPVATSPEERSEGIAQLDQISLTFEAPVEQGALARLLSLEVRPAPGIEATGGQLLSSADFDLRALERPRRDAKQTYVVQLRQPIPDARVLILRLRLADEPGLEEPSFEVRWRSAVPFTVTGMKCGRGLERETVDNVIRCTPEDYFSAEEGGTESRPSPRRRLLLGFSAPPEALDVVRAREVLRLTPPVDDLRVEADGSRLRLAGRFLAETTYELRLAPGSLRDTRQRPLAGAPFVQRFAFAAEKPVLRWDVRQGIVERFGPQFVPLRGRGYDRADVRIHAIDPLARDFWPFPPAGIDSLDSESPPLPGHEPTPWTLPTDLEDQAMLARIKALGSPAVSELMTLPMQRGGSEAKFGLDLKAAFARISGGEQPGSYLIGLRPTDGAKRQWLRVQVTDLSLSTVEEASRVRFTVTSLATARPVAEAQVRLEGVRDERFVTLARGVTDAQGAFVWSLEKRATAALKRIVVQKGLDTLVLDPERGPAGYSRENWSKPNKPWLAWTVDPQRVRSEQPRTLCHLFSERPIYRPEEPVHLKGFVRTYLGGALSTATRGGTLLVLGPGNQEWRIPMKLDGLGGLYHKFDAATPATGDYTVQFEPEGPASGAPPFGQEGREADDDPDTDAAGQAAATRACGTFTFKKEAYRLPTFEVLLHSPAQVPLDGEFSVDLVARYFAGGLLAERPVKWRATQFPHAWTPPGRPGFLFSTDSRFSGESTFRSTPVLERDGRTDAGGGAQLTFDTSLEPTAQPRRYFIEATVTGDDDIQVRNVHSVIALPPFVLGVKVPRYLPSPGSIEPEVLALGANGAPLADLNLTVRFVRRNWTSMLQASDFSQGSAKYVTQVLEETLLERQVRSTAEAQRLSFATQESGVYLVQVEATDRLGRRQQVSVDVFVGGTTPVTWARPPAQTATVTPDKESYAPGDTATLVLQSPFQNGRALAIVETPGGPFQYDWLDIAHGFGRYAVLLRKEAMPKLAVHFLLMRGRLPDSAPGPTTPFDQGKPVTIAATSWISITPVQHTATVTLDYPPRARPGQEVEISVHLRDHLGQPLAGEAVFWMVDQAVLSLARERPLDPLPHFIVERPTRMVARDTRNLAFGVLPLEEVPGGDGVIDEWGTDSNISVRKNFTPVPVYLPRVRIGPNGMARLKVTLPDTLTIFKLRAKAVSGPDRFGFASGEMLVRQEIVAQAALPRFVRPGDIFDAGLVGRVVEGPAGPGRATLAVEGLTLRGPGEQRFTWTEQRPARLDFPVTVAEPTSAAPQVRFRFGLRREADRVSDALQIDLPVQPDRPPQRQQALLDIAAGDHLELLPPGESPRPGSFQRQVTLAADPALVRLVAGLTYLVSYPFGCTEQRLALASATLALKPFAALLDAAGLAERVAADVRTTSQLIQQSLDADGLVAFWPRSRGYVSLTAWAYRFLVLAERAGEAVEPGLMERLAQVLKLALRSDYGRLFNGEELRERVEALSALAEAGRLDPSYVAELARRAEVLPNVSVAQMTAAVAQLPGEDRRLLQVLIETLWSRVKVLSRAGKPYYAGQAADGGSPIILPSEVRSLAAMARAVALATPEDARVAVLRDGLIRLGEGSGWGSTQANAAAIQALAALWQRPTAEAQLSVTRGSTVQQLTLHSETPVVRYVHTQPVAVRLDNTGQVPVVALVTTRWQPSEPGFRAQSLARGFVLSRQAWRLRAAGAPLERLTPEADGTLRLTVGDVIEEVVELANPEDRTHVAISLPLAAGLEPLNPQLATAPAEATPSAAPTLAPTWTAFGDERVFYAYERLPRGQYRFHFRLRAQVAGSFTQPPGEVETMYQVGAYGASAGERIVIGR